MGESKKVYQLDMDGNLIKEWASNGEAAKELGLDRSAIGKVARGISKSCGGYSWSYEQPIIGQCYDTPEEVEIIVEETMEQAQMKMRIFDHIPQYFLDQLYSLIDCQCPIEAYEHFLTGKFRLTIELQKAIRQFWREAKGERLSSSSCSSCWNRRLRLMREYLQSKIEPVA